MLQQMEDFGFPLVFLSIEPRTGALKRGHPIGTLAVSYQTSGLISDGVDGAESRACVNL